MKQYTLTPETEKTIEAYKQFQAACTNVSAALTALYGNGPQADALFDEFVTTTQPSIDWLENLIGTAVGRALDIVENVEQNRI